MLTLTTSDAAPAGKPGKLFNEKLEAPPGFEPGVEVLQTGSAIS